MIKRHANLLETRLEEIVFKGVTHIHWGELKLWYGAKRIAINTWRDIADRWEILADEGELGVLRRIDGQDGVFLIAEKTATKLV